MASLLASIRLPLAHQGPEKSPKQAEVTCTSYLQLQPAGDIQAHKGSPAEFLSAACQPSSHTTQPEQKDTTALKTQEPLLQREEGKEVTCTAD